LPDAFRTVFVLRALEELSVEESAVALGIPEATVALAFLPRAALLREALSKEIDLAYGDAFAFAGARLRPHRRRCAGEARGRRKPQSDYPLEKP